MNKNKNMNHPNLPVSVFFLSFPKHYQSTSKNKNRTKVIQCQCLNQSTNNPNTNQFLFQFLFRCSNRCTTTIQIQFWMNRCQYYSSMIRKECQSSNKSLMAILTNQCPKTNPNPNHCKNMNNLLNL